MGSCITVNMSSISDDSFVSLLYTKKTKNNVHVFHKNMCVPMCHWLAAQERLVTFAVDDIGSSTSLAGVTF